MRSFLFPALLTAVWAGHAAAADWIHWRGPEQNGFSRETNLPDTFGIDKPGENNLIWKQPYGCRSTPLVLDGRVYIINGAGEGVMEGERVMCFDAKTGKVLWEDKFNVFHTDIVSSRIGWTNLTADKETGYVYAHGTQGFLTCYDKNGKHIWQRQLTEEFGRVTGYGGRVVSPVCDGDLVIIGMINASWGDHGRGANRFVAFDKKTGAVVWWSDPCGQIKGTYYSNPVVAVINGQRLLITGAADGSLIALKVRTGEKVWGYTFGANVINSSPVVSGNLVYCSHGEENLDTNAQGRVICVDASKLVEKKGPDGKVTYEPTLVWEYKEGLKAGYTSPLLANDVLYVADDGAKLYAFDAKSGKQLWKRKFSYGRLARGSGVFADGKIYIFDVNAHFHILKPGPKECLELHDQFFRSKIPGTFVETNGTPSIADGRIYLATRDEILCIGKSDWKPNDAKVPEEPAEAPVAADTKATWLQLHPAEVTLNPGDSTTFKLRKYSAHGQYLGEADVASAEWTLPLPPPAPLPPNAPAGTKPRQPPALIGEIAAGKLTVPAIPNGQQAYVDAKSGDLVARARVRVAPKLPYKQDFEKVPVGAFISGSVNCQGKYAVVEKDGAKVLKKLADNPAPPLARANAYIGLPSYANYTIQADVLGAKKGDNIPDIGVVNNRYTLMLGGNKQELRIVSWEALPRLDKTIAFKWTPGTWYTLKLDVELNEKTAVVRGKVWPRGEPEPTGWTLEVSDPSPNREGAPAIYGYATGVLEGEPGAEAYYDNILIAPKK